MGHRLQIAAGSGAPDHLSPARRHLLATGGQGADDDDQQPIQWLALRGRVAGQVKGRERIMAETSAAGLVEYACRDRVATLTLNRPEKLNAFSHALVRHLADGLRP